MGQRLCAVVVIAPAGNGGRDTSVTISFSVLHFVVDPTLSDMRCHEQGMFAKVLL